MRKQGESEGREQHVRSEETEQSVVWRHRQETTMTLICDNGLDITSGRELATIAFSLRIIT